MKTSVLLLSISMLTFGAQAQQPLRNIADLLHLHHIALPAVQAHIAAKNTTVGESRLVAECALTNTTGTFVPQDSVALVYSGNRGGDLYHQPIKCDANTLYSYNSSTNTYTNEQLITNTFDANNNVIIETQQLWDVTNNVYVNNQQGTGTYDGNNNMLSDIQTNWDNTNNVWVNNIKDTYTYDGNNNTLTDLNQTWDATNNVWINNHQDTYTYTGANRISSDITTNWNAALSTWYNVNQHIYTYDGNNNMLTDIYQGWDNTNSIWVNSSQDLYTYDGMNDQTEDCAQTWTNGSWVNNTIYYYSNFITQYPQKEIYASWDAVNNVWDTSIEDILTSNSYNQPTSELEEIWTNGTWQTTTSSQLIRLYYEIYDLSVNTVSNTGGNVCIYPVPAQNELHINLTWDEPQSCNIAIYNVQGRVLKQWQIPVTTEYNNIISVSDLAEGSYFISITGSKGQITQKLIMTNK